MISDPLIDDVRRAVAPYFVRNAHRDLTPGRVAYPAYWLPGGTTISDVLTCAIDALDASIVTRMRPVVPAIMWATDTRPLPGEVLRWDIGLVLVLVLAPT